MRGCKCCVRMQHNWVTTFSLQEKRIWAPMLLLLLLLRGSVPWVAHVHAMRAQWSWRWQYEGSLSYFMARPRSVDLGGVF